MSTEVLYLEGCEVSEVTKVIGSDLSDEICGWHASRMN